MKLSVVIPCYNERATIEAVVDSVRAAPVEDIEIIVVDDGSTDGTRELLKAKPPGWVDKIVLQKRNFGKGAALRAGFQAATGDVVVVQDADLEYDPKEYPILLAPILEDRADVVFGSRFMGGRPHRVVYFWHMVGNRFLTLLSNMFTNLNLTDMETGYKAFRAPFIKSIQIKEDRFGVEPEIIAKLARTGCRIYEVGISYSGRTYREGKKINWKDGVRAVYAIIKYTLQRGQR
jgi:glycosyltransferase involved in cell wall biosynthesis